MPFVIINKTIVLAASEGKESIKSTISLVSNKLIQK